MSPLNDQVGARYQYPISPLGPLSVSRDQSPAGLEPPRAPKGSTPVRQRYGAILPPA
jgi:hypothetical protein